jgi:hypothetical protein
MKVCQDRKAGNAQIAQFFPQMNISKSVKMDILSDKRIYDYGSSLSDRFYRSTQGHGLNIFNSNHVEYDVFSLFFRSICQGLP